MKDFEMGPGNIIYFEDLKPPVVDTHCTSCGAPYTTHSGNCEYCGTIAPGSAAVVIDPIKESEAMRIARALYGVVNTGVTLKQTGSRGPK